MGVYGDWWANPLFRLFQGIAQIYLGMALGFLEKSADMHLIQHETRSSTPKADLCPLCLGHRLLCGAYVHPVLGGRPLLCWRRTKSPKRITTTGATTIRSLTKPRTMWRCRPRTSFAPSLVGHGRGRLLRNKNKKIHFISPKASIRKKMLKWAN